MNDIAERLRETLTGEASDEAMWCRIVRERDEAAAEIERLRAALDHLDADGVVGAYMEQRRLTETAERDNERLRAALRWVADNSTRHSITERARAALGEDA